MIHHTLLEEQLIFDLSQREGEITALRQQLAVLEAERDKLIQNRRQVRSIVRAIHHLIHDHLYYENSHETHFDH